MKTQRVKLSNTSELETIAINTAIIPECFVRLTPNLLLGIRTEDVTGKTNIENLSICYIYQKNEEEGLYKYVATLDIRPVETNIKVNSVKNPMQLKVYSNFMFDENSKGEQLALINENNQGNPIVPDQFRYVFGK
jgi:hypothetical protein